MKKLLLLLILSVATLQPVSAQSYRGFADLEGGLLTGHYDDALIGVTTTHGLQLAQKFFIGAGSGILIDIDGGFGGAVMPLYADFRFDFWNGKKVSPFIDLKAGYTLEISSDDYGFIGNGLYLNPSVGFRIRLTERMGINIGLAYSLINFYESKYYNWKELSSTISIKAGIDF